jgi:queuine tRNA-ribosyltransferase
MVRLTPEEATRVQNALGADIIMAFDDCPPAADPEGDGEGAEGSATGDGCELDDPRLRRAVARDRGKRGYDHAQRLDVANERTVRWLQRCADAHGRRDEQSLFGIVQGGTDLERRAWSAERVTNIELPGYAIGGVAVGETHDDIVRVVRHTAPLLPWEKPRYLMGVGYERDLVAAVRAGVDMFDCVLPTRNGRNANAFTRGGQIRLRNAKFAEDQRPIDEGCDCVACAGEPLGMGGGGWKAGVGFSRGYLRHLFMAGEMLGPILVTIHNLRHFQRLMADVRATIGTDDWAGLEGRWPVLGTIG